MRCFGLAYAVRRFGYGVILCVQNEKLLRESGRMQESRENGLLLNCVADQVTEASFCSGLHGRGRVDDARNRVAWWNAK